MYVPYSRFFFQLFGVETLNLTMEGVEDDICFNLLAETPESF